MLVSHNKKFIFCYDIYIFSFDKRSYDFVIFAFHCEISAHNISCTPCKFNWSSTNILPILMLKICLLYSYGLRTKCHYDISYFIFIVILVVIAIASPWRSGCRRCCRTYFDNSVSQHLSGAGSNPAGSVGRDLNLLKLNYQYLTTSVAVVLVVR